MRQRSIFSDLAVLVISFLLVFPFSDWLVASKAYAGGADCNEVYRDQVVAYLCMPEQGQIGHRPVTVRFQITNLMHERRFFTVNLWHGGANWGQEYTQPTVEPSAPSRSTLAQGGDLGGLLIAWTAILEPDESGYLELPTTTSDYTGTWPFVSGSILTSRGDTTTFQRAITLTR